MAMPRKMFENLHQIGAQNLRQRHERLRGDKRLHRGAEQHLPSQSIPCVHQLGLVNQVKLQQLVPHLES